MRQDHEGSAAQIRLAAAVVQLDGVAINHHIAKSYAVSRSRCSVASRRGPGSRQALGNVALLQAGVVGPTSVTGALTSTQHGFDIETQGCCICESAAA